MPLLGGATTQAPPFIHTVSHCCFGQVSTKTPEGKLYFPHKLQQKDSAHLEVQCNPRVCQTHILVLTKGPQGAHKPDKLHCSSNRGRAVPCPMRLGGIWVRSCVRRCQDTCSSPVSPLPPSNPPCTQSLFLQ